MSTTWPQLFPREVLLQASTGGRLTCLCLGLEAWRRGLKVTWVDGHLKHVVITGDDTSLRFLHSLPQSLTPPEDDERLIDKWATKSLLRARGISVPRGVLIENTASVTPQDLDAIARDVGYPLVIKPHDGTMGRGVFTGIETPVDLHRNFEYLRLRYPDSSILIEEHVIGDDYRVLVVGDNAVAAVKRVPASVEGDGSKTVRQLIDAKNAVRRLNPFLSKGLIKIDVEVNDLLAAQGLDLDGVPDARQNVRLRSAANASAGGDVVDCTDSLPEGMRQAAIDATAAMPNIHVAGVDFLHDADSGNGHSIIEINSRPHIGVHMFPTHGAGRDVPLAMIDHFFPTSRRPERPDDAMLTMDLKTTRRALLSRQADSMTVAPLPAHGFPVRLRWILPRTVERPLERIDTLRVLRAAADFKVSGSLTRAPDGAVHAIVAGDSEAACKGFADRVVELLGKVFLALRHEDLDYPEPWEGPLAVGFTVGDELVR